MSPRTPRSIAAFCAATALAGAPGALQGCADCEPPVRVQLVDTSGAPWTGTPEEVVWSKDGGPWRPCARVGDEWVCGELDYDALSGANPDKPGDYTVRIRAGGRTVTDELLVDTPTCRDVASTQITLTS